MSNTNNFNIKNGLAVGGNVVITSAGLLTGPAGAQLQSASDSGNTTLVYAQAGYAKANASGVIAQAAFDSGNTTLTLAQAAFNSGNTTLTYAQAAFASSNTNGSAITTIQSVDTTQNTNITAARTIGQAAYDSGNTTLTYAQAAFALSNTNSININTIQSIDNTQNTNITTATTIAQAAFNASNGASTFANNSFSSLTYTAAAYTQANTGTTLAQATFNSGNTTLTYAQSAYSTANGKFNSSGGTISGDTVVTGNLTVTGSRFYANTVSLVVEDNIITINSNVTGIPTLNAGIEVNRGSSTNTSLLWNETDKSWEFTNDGTNYDKIAGLIYANAAFALSNTNATNITTIQGVDTTQNTNIGLAYTQANTGTTLAQAAFNSGNTTLTYAQSAFALANIHSANIVTIQSIDNTQNTNITTVTTNATAAYTQANTGTVLAQASFDSGNTTLTYAQSAYSSGNTNSSAITVLQSVNSTQNTNITSVDAKAQAAFNIANTDVTNISTTSGIYGSTSVIPVVTLAANGRVSTITNTSIAIAASQVTSGQLAIAQGGTNASSFTGNLRVLFDGTKLSSLANNTTTVTGGLSTGNTISSLSVDNFGQVTAYTGSAISITSGQVSGLATSATTDTTNANNISTGTLNVSRLPTSGVSAGTYGGATQIPVITIDTYGRATVAANVALNAGATITDDTTTATTHYPLLAITNTGTLSVANTSSTKLTYVPSTGTLTTVDLNTTSDAQFKENVEPIVSPLDVLNNIDGVSFNWKDSGNKSYGVIAQELQKVLPELVKQGDYGLSVSYIPLIAILIEAVKEQQKQIDELKNK